MEASKHHFKVQLFATDIDSRAIDVARIGIYPASIAIDVSARRLARFFILQAGGITCRISKTIRDMVNFSEHDLTKDPPSSKLDLITCRNLLIYMSGELQKKLLLLFHYALRPGGLLFLGTFEVVGNFEEIFKSLDRQWKLYQRKDDVHSAYHPILNRLFLPLPEAGMSMRSSGHIQEQGRYHLRELTERLWLQRYAPLGALVGERGEIPYLHGRTCRFLEPPPGEASLNILKMAREGLSYDLATALYKAVTHQQEVSHPGLRVKTNGDFTAVTQAVVSVASAAFDDFRIDSSASEQKIYLVVLEDVVKV